jgi:hypothetical protein
MGAAARAAGDPGLRRVLGAIEPVLRRPGGLLECPRLTADGAVLYSDVTGGGVYRDGEPVVPKRRGVGGLVEHRDGGLVITGRTLLHGDCELLARDDLTGFNDLTTTPEGEVIVGALRFHPFAGEDPVPGQLLLLRGPGDAVVLDESLLWPNGIGLSPDGERLYACDYARRQVLTNHDDRHAVPGPQRGRRRSGRARGHLTYRTPSTSAMALGLTPRASASAVPRGVVIETSMSSASSAVANAVGPAASSTALSARRTSGCGTGTSSRRRPKERSASATIAWCDRVSGPASSILSAASPSRCSAATTAAAASWAQIGWNSARPAPGSTITGSSESRSSSVSQGSPGA